MQREKVTIEQVIRQGAERFEQAGLFFGHGTDNAIDEAAWLVLHALHLPPEIPECVYATPLTEAELESVEAILQRRIDSRMPAAYLTGTAWFCGLKFFVDPRVLVPRSPLAELIVDGFYPWLGELKVKRVLDIGTGSGCIAIACAYAFVEAEVDAADISSEALAVAQRNIDHHQLQSRVRAVESDLFSALSDVRYDIIISNPPYVDEDDMAAMPDEFRCEPELGLASGSDGLDHARGILSRAAEHLNPGGLLIVEVGNSAEALAQRYPYVPFTWLDFAQGGDGVFLLTREALLEYQKTGSW